MPGDKVTSIVRDAPFVPQSPPGETCAQDRALQNPEQAQRPLSTHRIEPAPPPTAARSRLGRAWECVKRWFERTFQAALGGCWGCSRAARLAELRKKLGQVRIDVEQLSQDIEALPPRGPPLQGSSAPTNQSVGRRIKLELDARHLLLQMTKLHGQLLTRLPKLDGDDGHAMEREVEDLTKKLYLLQDKARPEAPGTLDELIADLAIDLGQLWDEASRVDADPEQCRRQLDVLRERARELWSRSESEPSGAPGRRPGEHPAPQQETPADPLVPRPASPFHSTAFRPRQEKLLELSERLQMLEKQLLVRFPPPRHARTRPTFYP